MTKVKHFKFEELEFKNYGDSNVGKARIARIVGTETSSSMGAGIATFDKSSIRWRVSYDELIVVLYGLFKLRHGENSVGMI